MSIPPHLSEALFRRWEPVLRTAIATIAISGHYNIPLQLLSATTTAAQLRSAIRSLRLYHWSSDLDAATLADLEIVQRNDVVTVQPRRKAAVLSTATTAAAAAPTALTVDSPSTAVLNALCVLHHNSILTSPTKLTNINRTNVEAATAAYDISVDYVDATTAVIL